MTTLRAHQLRLQMLVTCLMVMLFLLQPLRVLGAETLVSPIEAPAVSAEAIYVMDTTSGIPLYSKNPDMLVVMTHFTPTPSTLGSEPPLKYWMLGNALLGATIDEFAPTLVVHGHAHLGNEHGTTEAGVPVRNVALQVTQGIRLLSLCADGTVVSTGLRPIAGMDHETSVRESDVR